MIAECYIDKGEMAVPQHVYPLNFKLIQKEQQKDKAFLEALKNQRQNMMSRFFGGRIRAEA